MSKKGLIGILVVTYNQYEMTRRWIRHFLEQFAGDSSLMLLVLDGNSPDGSCARLRDEFPQIDLRLLNANYGCSTGRNVGIAELAARGCEFYFGCDADVFITSPTFFDECRRFMADHPDVAGLGPVLRWAEDRSIQAVGGRRAWHGALKTVTEIGDDRDLHCIQGGASFIRMSAFRKYGMFDNDQPPVGAEDLEWGYRATRLGAKLQYSPTIEVLHQHAKQAPCSLATRKWVLEGRTIFLRKHFNLGSLLREVRFASSILRSWGPRLVLSGYAAGLRKKLHSKSWDFETFVGEGTERFFATASAPTAELGGRACV